MKNKLKKLLDNAYAPYSDFKVAAILETTNGKLYKGVNVENASYGASICAERVAINNAIADGVSKDEIYRLHLMASKDNVFPCNLCRQTFTEFFNSDVEIVIYDSHLERVIFMDDLCPYQFTKENL